MEKHVFISYTGKDSPVAEKIATALKAHHIRCWIAPAEIGPGDKWLKKMLDAVEQSSLVVLVFSAQTNDAQWVKDEITLALNKRIRIIPFRIEDVEPQGELRSIALRYQWLDAFPPLCGPTLFGATSLLGTGHPLERTVYADRRNHPPYPAAL